MISYSKGSLYAADPKSQMVLYVLQEGFCNSRCKHCYMLLQNQTARKRNIGVAKKDLESLANLGYNVHLRGTEMLLNPEYLSLFPLIKQKYIQTNGKELVKKPALFKKMTDAGIKKIMLTYPTEPSDLVDFSKEVVDKAISMSYKEGYRTIIDFIITKEVVNSFRKNKDHFKDIADYLLKIGSDELRFVRLIPLSSNLKSISPSTEEMEEIVEESVLLEAEYKGKIDITRAGQFGFFDLRRELKERFFGIKIPLPENSGIMDCPAGNRLFVIDVDNNIYPCLYLMNPDYKIGIFREGNLILEKPEIASSRIHLKDCPAAIINNGN